MSEHLLKNSLHSKKLSDHTSRIGVQHLLGNNFWYATIPVDQSLAISSEFYALEKKITHRGLALKYVLSGEENYHYDRRSLKISDGQYLLVNEYYPQGDVLIQDGNNKSVCLDIDLLLIKDILQNATQPDQIDAVSEIGNFLMSPDLFIQECSAGELLHKRLASLYWGMKNDHFLLSPQEIIYDIAQLLIWENLPSIKAYYQIKTAKSATRKELYRRLLYGKSYLDEHIFTPVEMKKIAQECCMSEFRFYRYFKQVFKCSPYNYLLSKRIDKSIELKKHALSWTEISNLLNFSDLSAFSHAFRKIKGVHPSAYPKNWNK